MSTTTDAGWVARVPYANAEGRDTGEHIATPGRGDYFTRSKLASCERVPSGRWRRTLHVTPEGVDAIIDNFAPRPAHPLFCRWP